MITRPKNKSLIIIALIILVIGLVIVLLRGNEDAWIKDENGNWVKHGNPQINNFEECAKYFPIMESYPEQCRTPDGQNFVKQY